MTHQEFNQLLKRYLAGETTEQEENLLLEWYESPANQQELDLPERQKEAIKKRMWQKIRQNLPARTFLRPLHLAWLSGVAACLLVGAGWYWGWDKPLSTFPKATQEVVSQSGIEVKNTLQTEQEVVLPDGTKVTLSQNSQLVYNKAFNQTRREVYLTGEAFFDVKRDENKPFVVHTDDLVTEVLGTSFRIRQNHNSRTTEVSVRSGKVSVYALETTTNREHNGVIITQNQRAVYNATTHTIVPGIVEAPIPVIEVREIAGNLIFQEASLPQVLGELTRLYGIEFVISNPKSNECRLTADLNGLTLFTQLDLICKSIDATYEKRGTVVFISGEGC
ncbi:FecR family protein [Arundinibacter roseus]|uniref:FecR family protein n=1 Tax=Arundinibacter roseus TaxID=2070510 RepID=A0A4R4K4N0_9BACT|nr:FecR family protein [Arundinibacter roseus]TDB62330.1 FecR family protein [Arundinibacter roseus]